MMTSMILDLGKMPTQLQDGNAQYFLDEPKTICLNDYLGRKITIQHTQAIHCVACGRLTKKSFNQGYCFPCVRSLAQCDTCIVKPELCHYHQGTCREPQWGEAHCLKPHFVYLANTGAVKVGITRERNIPHRWIDQGATQALPILQVNQRLISGLAETAFKAHVADKTNWRTMLKSEPLSLDLCEIRDQLFTEVRAGLDQIQQQYGVNAIESVTNNDIISINYPVIEYPTKIQSLNLDKTPTVEGVLLGIKGQYLILDTGVINIRKYGGYHCEVRLGA